MGMDNKFSTTFIGDAEVPVCNDCGCLVHPHPDHLHKHVRVCPGRDG